MTFGSWENVTCPICENVQDGKLFLTCSDRFHNPKLRKYNLRKCNGCGLISLNPRPRCSDLDKHYCAEDYDPFLSIKQSRSVLDRIYSSSRSWTLKWKKNLVAKLAANRAKILDVGCGTGEFLDRLAPDFAVEGTEPEPDAARWAREKLGLKVHTGYLAEISLEYEQFDLVTLWHVLEHIPDPVQELQIINKILAQDGKLLIALPNIGSIDAGIYKSCWIALDAPRHLWHFTSKTLGALAQKCGFSLVQTGMLPLDTFYNTLHSELLCIKTRGLTSLILAPLRMPIAVTASLLSGVITGQHSGMYYIFQKS